MYDSPRELLRKIRLGEDSTLELKVLHFRGDKVVQPKRNDLADEIAAIANTAHGVLVLGVDDDRSIVGIAPELLGAAERLVFEICHDSIKPPVAFRSIRMEIGEHESESRPVLKIDIPRSLYVHQSPGGYLFRQGSSKRPLPPEQLARLFQQRSQARLIRFDEQVVPGTSPDDLQPELVGRFVGEVEDPALVMSKLGLVREDEDGDVRVSVAGVLLGTSQPSRWLPGALIRAAFYKGTDQASNYLLDTQEIEGPLDTQVRKALSFVERNMRVAAHKNPDREEFPQYSSRAAFEALVNAVAHRDYSIHGSTIRLFMFDDRLELYSPGALANTLTVESLPLRQSTRNELVASLLSKCRVEAAANRVGRKFMMDKRGDGVPIILGESTRLSGREPEYRMIDDAELLLTIWAAEPPVPD